MQKISAGKFCFILKIISSQKNKITGGTRLGKAKERKEDKIKKEAQSGKCHLSDILITQSLNKHFFFKHLFALISE